MVAGKSKWQLLTPKEVADIFRVEEGIVEELIRRGELKALSVGNEWRVPERVVDAYVERGLGHDAIDLAKSGREAPATDRSDVIAARFTRRTREVEFVLLGQSYKAANSISVLTLALAELAGRDQTFLERFSNEGGRTRRYISKDRTLLYDGRADLAEKYAKPLPGGWWMGTNYSRDEINRILRRACAVAGLRFGVDLVIRESVPAIVASTNLARAFRGKGHSGLGDLARRHDEYLTEP